MKNLMNRLGMVAVIAALGFAGYLVVSHFSVNRANVKIQVNCTGIGCRCKNNDDCSSKICNNSISSDYLECAPNLRNSN